MIYDDAKENALNEMRLVKRRYDGGGE